MHHVFCPNDLRTENLRDALMSKTDAKDRCFIRKTLDHFECDARLVRRSGSRRDDDLFRTQRFDIIDTQLVVTDNHQIGTELFAVLNDIIGKTVIVVYH